MRIDGLESEMIVATAAVVVGVCALFVSVYQASIMREQQRGMTIQGIETTRLVLRHFTAFDEHDLAGLLSDPNVMQFSLGVKSPVQIRTWLNERLEDQEQNPSRCLLAVLLKKSEQFIGYCGLLEYKDIGGRPEIEIGYRLIKSEWGHGYATEAATAIRDYGFRELNRKRLIALIDPENFGSIAVAKKIGMSYEKEIMMKG